MSEAHRVATAEQARILLDVTTRPLLDLLMTGEHSASQVAAYLGVSVQRAHYLLEKWRRADIAKVNRVQPRSGRAVRYYTMAPRWFVPFAVTGEETLETFVDAQILPRMQRFVGLGIRQIGERYRDWGYWLDGGSLNMGNPDGEAQQLFEGDEPFLLNLGTIRLSPERSSALKQRLLAAVEEFRAQHDPQEPAYTVGLLLARGDVG